MADTDEEYLNSDLTGSQIEGILTGIFGVVGILKRKNDTTFEAATIYEVLSGASAPTTSTVGAVNQFYRTSTDLYICTAVSNANYTWTKYTKSISDLYAVSFNQSQTLTDIQKSTALANIAASREVLSGNGAPTTSTVGKVNQLYRNTANNKVYICTGTNGTTYTWVEVNPMADIGAVLYGSAQTLSDAQKTQALNNISASRAVLTGAADPTSATTAFVNQLYRNTTTNEVFICTEVSGGSSSWISLKYGAPLFSAIQSLTEPQKSRILSNISASREVLSGVSNPTTSTVGVVNQFYRNTTNNKMFVCTAVSGSTYTWVEFQGSGGGGGSDTPELYIAECTVDPDDEYSVTSDEDYDDLLYEMDCGKEIICRCTVSGTHDILWLNLVKSHNTQANGASTSPFVFEGLTLDSNDEYVKVILAFEWNNDWTYQEISFGGSSVGAVLYSESQSLTSEQKTTARTNIGALSDTPGSQYAGYLLTVNASGRIVPQQFSTWSGGNF